MVKVYDPSRTDISTYFINKIKEIIYYRKNSLSNEEIYKSIENILKQDQYKYILNKFEESHSEFPEILLKNCKNQYFFLRTEEHDYKFFKASTNFKNNTITVCANKITNLLELKENLDREFILSYDYNVKKIDMNNDEIYAGSIISACKAQIENYKQFNEETKVEMTKLCAKYLFKHRAPNQNCFPFDIWVRFSRKIIDKMFYKYYEPLPIIYN